MKKYGYYHAANEDGCTSWYNFCRKNYQQCGLMVTVLPVSTTEYGMNKVARPANSRLGKRKLVENGFILLPDWQDALTRFLTEVNLDVSD